MYRSTRQIHRWVGIFASLMLVVIASTGFFLTMKDRLDWMRPPPAEAQEIAGPAEVVSIQTAVEAAFALGHPELQTFEQIDRVDYRPGKNIFKVISKDGYREVQVDGKTGQVLSSSFRNDQLFEDIHDFSFFADWVKAWISPPVALGLFILGLSGIGLFFTPIVRRWQFKKSHPGVKRKPD